MAYIVTKMSALATNIAFCHDCTSSNYISRLTDNGIMIAEFVAFGKQNIIKFLKSYRNSPEDENVVIWGGIIAGRKGNDTHAGGCDR